MENFVANYSPLLSRHKDVQTFFQNFLPPWNQLLEKLATAKSPSSTLEDQFSLYSKIAKQALPTFEKMKVPGDFKDFQEMVSKGVGQLSDWCLDMSNRVRYGQTDYQKKAYMKRLEGFQNEWYDIFFDPAVENLKNEWAIFSAEHWLESLTPEQQNTIRKNAPVFQYLNNYSKISLSHLKAMAELANKAREARDDSDEQTYLSNLQKQHSDLESTISRLKKITPAPEFQEFHDFYIAWLTRLAEGNAIQIQIEEATNDHKPNDEIQELTYQRNQANVAAGQIQGKLSDAYEESLKKVGAAPLSNEPREPRRQKEGGSGLSN